MTPPEILQLSSVEGYGICDSLVGGMGVWVSFCTRCNAEGMGVWVVCDCEGMG